MKTALIGITTKAENVVQRRFMHKNRIVSDITQTEKYWFTDPELMQKTRK